MPQLDGRRAGAFLCLFLFCGLASFASACRVEKKGLNGPIEDAGPDSRSDRGIDDPDLGRDATVDQPPRGDLPPGSKPDVVPPAPDVPVPVDLPPEGPPPGPVGCPTGQRMCATGCIPAAGCCLDSECPGYFACTAKACSQTVCRTGFKLCGAACIAANACCAATGCCSHAECGPCQKCMAGACVNQSASEDLKNECASAACHSGNCSGSGACGVTPDGQNGPSCGGECVRCMGAACRPRVGMCSSGLQCEDGKCPDRPPVAVRINVNGPAHGGFQEDLGGGGVCNGSEFFHVGGIAGTDDDPLYQGEMFGAPLVCAVGGQLPPGPYRVVLHFAEIYFGPGCLGGGLGVGARVFDIQIEGRTVATDVDLFAEAGCAASPLGGRPVVKSFNVTISDGTLDLNFPAKVNNGKISAIEVISAW